MSVVGYPCKAKGVHLLTAFCGGAGGRVAQPLPRELHPGAAAFYGVTDTTKPLWRQAGGEGRTRVYLDNAYLDPTREVYFRATKNRLQHDGSGESDCRRFDGHRIPIQPWRTSGSHVLICPQSDQFMRTVVEYPGSWLDDTLAQLKTLTDRPLRVRPWTGNKRAWYASLPDDLKDCWALVTYSSASAITAILAGVPAIVTGEDSIAWRMSGRIEAIESPPMPDNRREWAGVLADRQFSIPEMRSGMAWSVVNAG